MDRIVVAAITLYCEHVHTCINTLGDIHDYCGIVTSKAYACTSPNFVQLSLKPRGLHVLTIKLCS